MKHKTESPFSADSCTCNIFFYTLYKMSFTSSTNWFKHMLYGRNTKDLITQLPAHVSGHWGQHWELTVCYMLEHNLQAWRLHETNCCHLVLTFIYIFKLQNILKCQCKVFKCFSKLIVPSTEIIVFHFHWVYVLFCV